MVDMQYNNLTYSLVIPVYNSGKWLDDLINRIENTMSKIAPDSFELIMIDDCSPDNETWTAIKRNADKHGWIRGYSLLYNVGQFKAILCGIEFAQGQFIITMDDDLQHPPEELPKLIKAMQENPTLDCIMGKYIVKKHSYLRNMGTLFMRFIMRFLYSSPPHVVNSSFRIMPSSFAKTLTIYRIAEPQLGPLILTLTQKIKNVPIQHAVRSYGVSGYSLKYSAKLTLKSVINASILPLRLFSLLGFTVAGFSFLLGIYYFFRWLSFGTDVPGFTTLILLLTFFNGMMLMGIGILGEYIGRIIKEITGMPNYFVKLKTTN